MSNQEMLDSLVFISERRLESPKNTLFKDEYISLRRSYKYRVSADKAPDIDLTKYINENINKS